MIDRRTVRYRNIKSAAGLWFVPLFFVALSASFVFAIAQDFREVACRVAGTPRAAKVLCIWKTGARHERYHAAYRYPDGGIIRQGQSSITRAQYQAYISEGAEPRTARRAAEPMVVSVLTMPWGRYDAVEIPSDEQSYLLWQDAGWALLAVAIALGARAMRRNVRLERRLCAMGIPVIGEVMAKTSRNSGRSMVYVL